MSRRRRYRRLRRRRPSAFSEFDLSDRRGIDDNQRVKAERTYREVRRWYHGAQRRLGPHGQKFENGLSSKIRSIKSSIREVMDPKKRKSAGDF